MPVNLEYNFQDETLNIKDRRPRTGPIPGACGIPPMPNFKCPFEIEKGLMDKLKNEVIKKLTDINSYDEIIYNENDDTVLIEHGDQVYRITVENLIKYMIKNYSINELNYITKMNESDMILVQQIDGAKKMSLSGFLAGILTDLSFSYDYDSETETLNLVLASENPVESTNIINMLNNIGDRLTSIENRLTALEGNGN